MYREVLLVPYRLCSIVAFPMFREAMQVTFYDFILF